MKPVLKASFRLKESYYVKPLVESDVNEEYVSWLNDLETTRYLSAERPDKVTVASQKEYVRRIRESSHDMIFGLFDNKKRLIGSSGIQGLNTSEVGPWVGVLIGPKECRGLGLGTAFLWIVTHILFSHFKISRTYAGIRVLNGAVNAASRNAFLKTGYREHISLTKKYNCEENCAKKVIVVSCSQSDLIAPENIGITDMCISGT